jgi:hypothetical protein
MPRVCNTSCRYRYMRSASQGPKAAVARDTAALILDGAAPNQLDMAKRAHAQISVADRIRVVCRFHSA